MYSFIYVGLYTHVGVGAHWVQKKVLYSGAEFTGSCMLPDVGPGNWTPVLCKCAKNS